MKKCQDIMPVLAWGDLEKDGVSASDVYPVAISETDHDIFVMVKPGKPMAGTIIWFAGYEIERFPTFDDFFSSAVAYNKTLYQEMKGN